MGDITTLTPDPPAEVRETNHFSTLLSWEETLKNAGQQFKGQGTIKVKVEKSQVTRSQSDEWVQCYKGMAKEYKFTDLEPKQTYRFRFSFEQGGKSSQHSAPTTVTTTREPLYAENLHMAIKRQNLEELVQVLKSGEVSPDVQNADNFTALMAAAKKPFVEALDVLIEYGADINLQNQSGKTALMTACVANMLDSVKALRRAGANYEVYDNGGCTAIHWAVDTRSVKLIDFMGADGADFNLKDHGHGGWTPLIRCATLHGDRDVGLAIMMNGGRLDETDNNGSTALHHAVMRRHFDLTQVLLQRKANPLIANKESTTPYQIATSHEDKRRIAELMTPYVEDIKLANKKTAVKMAKDRSGSISATQALVK